MKTDAIIIMDGFGLRDALRGNAIAEEGTPNLKALMKKYPHTQIEASGKAVGLPAGGTPQLRRGTGCVSRHFFNRPRNRNRRIF